MQDVKYENIEQQRIDNFLFSCFRKVPKALIYRLIRKNNIKLNGKNVKHLTKLKQNDIVRVPDFLFEEQHLNRIIKEEKTLSINETEKLKNITDSVLFEDDSLYIINKPANLAVHAGSFSTIGVIELLQKQNPEYELVHRLDRSTTGCLIIAKNRKTTKQLHQVFREHKIKKSYIALVHGHIDKSLNKIDFPLYKKEKAEVRKKVEVNYKLGKAAITYLRKVKWLHLDDSLFATMQQKNSIQRKYSLVEIDLQTGRTHQIRVHLAHLSHPIVGDDRYNSQNFSNLKVRSLMLHCSKLTFNHPLSGQKIEVIADLKADFKKIVRYISQIN